MNKIYFLCMLGILTMLASCSQDEGLYSTNTVTVTATLPEEIQSRSVDTDEELTNIERCILVVYRAGTTDAPVFSVEGTRKDNSFTFNLLMDDLTSLYDFYCWADDGGVTYDITDLTHITFKGDAPASSGHRGEAKDENVADHAVNISLSHVAAKIRLETTSGLSSSALISATVTMHTSYNALTGKVNKETKEVTITATGLTGLGASEVTPQKVLSFCALVDADAPNQTVHLVYGEREEYIPNVPIKADYCTTLRGSLAELGFMPYTVSVAIDQHWNDWTDTLQP